MIARVQETKANWKKVKRKKIEKKTKDKGKIKPKRRFNITQQLSNNKNW